MYAWAAKTWALVDGMALAKGLDLESLPAPRLFHALIAIAIEMNTQDEEIVKAREKFLSTLADMAKEPEEIFDDFMTPPIPGLREMPLGVIE